MAAAALLAVVRTSEAGHVAPRRGCSTACCSPRVAAAAIQLVPLPPALLAAISPHADAIRSALYLAPPDGAAWQPLSVAPVLHRVCVGLVMSVLVVFWAARRACALGLSRRIVHHVALAGLVAALVAIALQARGDPSLIYGRWRPLDAGARPFGPFVNRNHFATWVLMACPLAAGYVAAALGGRRPSPGLPRKAVSHRSSGSARAPRGSGWPAW